MQESETKHWQTESRNRKNMPHDQFGFMPSKQNCLNIRKSVSVIYRIREVKRISYDCQVNEFGGFQCPLSVEAFSDQIIKTALLLCWVFPPRWDMDQGVGMAALKSDLNSRKSRNTSRAGGVPGKHWQESGSPGPTEKGPLARGLIRGPPPSSPWEQTRALTVRRETGCWESMIPAWRRPWSQESIEGSPAPPSPGGQQGLHEPSGLPHPWDIPSEGQLGPWVEQALKRHVHTHTYSYLGRWSLLLGSPGQVQVSQSHTSKCLNRLAWTSPWVGLP